MKHPSGLYRKTLLMVFKLRRSINTILGTRVLDYPYASLKIYTRNIREYTTRARSCEKEPETCDWLDFITKSGGTFYDVGANVGAYTLIAAARGMNVVAFEPSAANYAALCENARLNKLEASVLVLPFVLGNSNGVFRFPVSDTTSGATASFVNGQATKNDHAPLPSLRLDEAVSTLKLILPTALKIDVDGGEVEVLKGAQHILHAESLKHILIEVDDSLVSEVRSILTEANFIEVSTHMRHAGVNNMIFRRI